MKLIKILAFAVSLTLILSLVGCDFSTLLGGDDTELNDDSFGKHYGDSSGTDDENDGNNDDGNKDDGNNDVGNNGDGGKDDGNVNENPDHVCDYKLFSKKEATCLAEGEEIYKCSCGKEQKKTLDVLSHTEVIDPAQEPSGSKPGKTEGKHCSVCGTVIVEQEYIFVDDYAVPEKYDGDYAYNSLLKLPNGEKLTKLYNKIDKVADNFHNGDADLTAEDKYVMAVVNYSELGIDTEDAIAVWTAYRTDRPLYYWMSNNISYDSREIHIICDADYAKASVRAELNAKIYAGVEAYVEEGYSASKYNTALAFHDLIIFAIDYAYESDGVTPEDDVWAHNVIGVFDKGYGVCESYSKTFQLLLNYCDIENILVSGWANEAHAWNLIKLDDNNWYWCDLTWDDTPEFMWGISYRYFCVNDTENVGWTDGPFTMAPSTFTSAHIPNNRIDTGINYNYDLPARSSTSYTGAEIMLKDTFKIGNLTYAVAGYNCVQLVEISADGDVNVPAEVTYKGESLKVISIGKMKDGKFNVGSIASYLNGIYTEQYTVGKITIPESVIFIWDDAFEMDYLTEINVNAANECFASVDGVLFSKNLEVLIKYPTAKKGTSYTLPAETRKIAAGAFSTLYSNTGDKLELEIIRLASNILDAGVRNYGYGYKDAKYFEENPWTAIRSVLSGTAVIYDKSGNVLADA